MSEQLNNNHEQEPSITEQLNAENANELSRAAFEQSGMSYMEWLDQGGYAGHLRRTETEQSSPTEEGQTKSERGYREARVETLSGLEDDPDRVAEQVVTKNGESWSYVRDDEGRKHRIGSKEAADLAQSHYMSLSEAEKAEVSGGKASRNQSKEKNEPRDRVGEFLATVDSIRDDYIELMEFGEPEDDSEVIKASEIDPDDHEFWNALDSKRQEYLGRVEQGQMRAVYADRLAMIGIIQAGYDLTPKNFAKILGMDPESPRLMDEFEHTYSVIKSYVEDDGKAQGGTGFNSNRAAQGPNSDNSNAEVIQLPVSSNPEGSDEQGDANEEENSDGNEDADQDTPSSEQHPSNSERQTRRRGFFEDLSRTVADRMLSAGLAERVHHFWDNREEKQNEPMSRRKKMAGALAGLALASFIGGGLANSSSPEDTPREPGVTAGPEDKENDSSDEEKPLSPEVANFEYTVGQGHGATHMVHELAQTMGYELSNDELLEVANNNADGFLSEGLTVPMDVPKGGETGGFQQAGVDISAEQHKELFNSLAKDIKNVVNQRTSNAA